MLFNYLKISNCFIGQNASFAKKLNIKCEEFQIILPMIALEINLTMPMAYLQLKKKLCPTETFLSRFFDSDRQRKTPTVIRHLLSSLKQPTTLWPKAPDFAF